jgi:hypothetical protein
MLDRSVTAEDQGIVNSIVELVAQCYSFVPDSDPVDAFCSVFCSLREALLCELEHPKPIVDSSPNDLIGSQEQNSMNLVVRAADVFSKHEFYSRVTILLTHRIDTDHGET